ncbi:unnamed protein product, partial [Vitis vinifera]
MFEAIPPADAILLKWILHDWNHDECVKILKRCRDAIPSKEKGGKLFFDAGFSGYKITPMLGLRSLIEVYP